MPFIGERILDMFNNIVNQAMRTTRAKYRSRGYQVEDEEESKEVDSEKAGEQIDLVVKEFAQRQAKAEAEKKGALLRNKVKAMGRIGKIYNTLKDEHVILLKLK